MKKSVKIRYAVHSFWADLKMLVHESRAILKPNFAPVVLFVLLHTAVGIVLLDTIEPVVTGLCMKISGIDYIAQDTFFTYWRHPVNILLNLLCLFIYTSLSVFEIAGVLHAFSMGKIGKKTTVPGMVSAGLSGGLRSLRVRNWLIFPFIIILLPLTGLISLSTSLFRVEIPEYIMDYISANKILLTVGTLIFIGLILVELRNLFALLSFSLEKKDFIPACRTSAKLIRGNYIRTVGLLLVMGLCASAVIVCISALISEIGTGIMEFLNSHFGSVSREYYSKTLANLFKGLMQAVFMPVITLAGLTSLFFQINEENNMLLTISKDAFVDRKPKKAVSVLLIILLVVLSGSMVWKNHNYLGKFADPVKQPVLVAHRGDSVRCPENTMPAFEKAVLEQADCIELDIHETRDGVIIVSHDDDLTRVSGKNIFVHDATYDEIKDLDVGSWFSPEFSYVRLSTLDEVLQMLRDTNTSVQIEIKVNGFEDHLEEKLLEVINRNDMHDRCVIISLSKEPLKRIKELDPTILTAFVMYTASNGVAELDFPDHLSIEAKNYSRNLADRIHAEGKRCYAWTVNKEDDLQFLVDCGADAILTDDPIMLRNALDRCDYSGGILRTLRLLGNRLSKGY